MLSAEYIGCILKLLSRLVVRVTNIFEALIEHDLNLAHCLIGVFKVSLFIVLLDFLLDVNLIIIHDNVTKLFPRFKTVLTLDLIELFFVAQL